MKTAQALSHEDSPSECNSSLQKLLHGYSQPSIASAISLEHPDKSQNALFYPLSSQYKCSNSSQHKIYLCDYQYEGQKWSIEISATSFEDAGKRLSALKYGEIVGELKFSMPAPIKQSWLTRLQQWLG